MMRRTPHTARLAAEKIAASTPYSEIDAEELGSLVAMCQQELDGRTPIDFMAEFDQNFKEFFAHPAFKH